MTREEADRAVQMAAAKLGEHFDGVLILATWEDDGKSRFSHGGSGSWYTWTGLAREFLIRDEKITPPFADGEETDDDDEDDGE